jgi:hypothetical protein
MSPKIDTTPIRIQLSLGDACSFPADVAFIGSGPALVGEIEQATRKCFEPLIYPEWVLRKYGPLDGLRHTRILSCDDFTWKHTVSLGGRPSRRVRKAFAAEMMEAFDVVVRKTVRPDSVLLVPYHREPADLVVKMTLFFAWCIHRQPVSRQRFYRPNTIHIVDAEDVTIFQELIGPRSEELQGFIRDLLQRFWWADYSETSATFEII